MSRLDDEADAQRARLLALDAQAHRDLIDAYQRVERQLDRDLEALVDRIERAQASGVEVRESWLRTERRYLLLLDQLRERLDDFNDVAIGVAVTTQGKTVREAPAHARDLTLAALGPAPRGPTASVTNTFDRLPTEALERLIGNTQTGAPLGVLFETIAPQGAREVRDTLLSGIARGQNPRVIARAVREVAELPALRAMTITRTESLRAYRQATTETYRKSGLVQAWVWHATRSERTCPVCLAMHGTAHSLDEQLSSHPNCRCVQVPKTASWEELGFKGTPDTRPTIQTGEELFDQMDDGDRLAILGRQRLDAYEAGNLTLKDMVRPTQDPVWGPGLRQASLRELLLA